MLFSRLAAVVVLSLALAAPSTAQEDAIGVPGPITFEDTAFTLAWTSNPTASYFKQEYLPKGETLEAYSQMFMVEVLTEGATPQSAAAGMIASLDQRKGSDPVVNYDLISNEVTGEYVLDFLISDSSSGTIIVEWNAYRYAPLGDGTALYAISRRGYGDGAATFLGGLKDWRTATITALATQQFPAVSLD